MDFNKYLTDEILTKKAKILWQNESLPQGFTKKNLVKPLWLKLFSFGCLPARRVESSTASLWQVADSTR